MTRRAAVASLAFALIAPICAPLTDAGAGAGAGVGLGYPSDTAGTGAPDARVTVVDDFGRRVTVRYPPQRIVSLAPAATAMLLAAGAGSRVVATIEYSGQPASERGIPRIGNAEAIDMERLIAARPDVVVVWPDGNNPAQVAAIARLGMPIYRQEAGTLAGLADSLRRLGRLAGTTMIADRAAEALEAKLALLARQYGNVPNPPTAFLEVWDRPLYTVGGHELMSDALRLCGVRNVFGDLPQRAPAIGIEAVIARNPDIIIAAAPPGRGRSWLAAWKRFPSLRAVKTGRMMIFEDQRLIGLGPGAIDATAAMCRKLAALRSRKAGSR
jgi:iron complex transport system substrate-binding protein